MHLGVDRKEERECLFKEIMAKNFSNLKREGYPSP